MATITKKRKRKRRPTVADDVKELEFKPTRQLFSTRAVNVVPEVVGRVLTLEQEKELVCMLSATELSRLVTSRVITMGMFDAQSMTPHPGYRFDALALGRG